MQSARAGRMVAEGLPSCAPAGESLSPSDPPAEALLAATRWAAECYGPTVDPAVGPFSAWALAQTDGRGVDLVVDPLGAAWPESMRSLAPGGRLVVCGATAGNRPELDIRELYRRHRRILGAPMGNWHDFVSVMRLTFQGELAPVIDRVYPLAQVADAHRRVKSREGFGKVVLNV